MRNLLALALSPLLSLSLVAQTPGVAWVTDRIREPLRRAADAADIPDDVWPDGVEHASETEVGDDVDRVAALQLSDPGDLPALKKSLTAQWQLVEPVNNKPVARVEVRGPAVAANVVAVLHHHTLS